MFELKVINSFSAAHQLRMVAEKCENLHGHNWGVEAVVICKTLKNGMVMDFGDLKKILKEVLLPLDHIFLNDLSAFKKNSPTSENIAKYIFNEIRGKLPKRVKLDSVMVSETENNIASYSE